MRNRQKKKLIGKWLTDGLEQPVNPAQLDAVVEEVCEAIEAFRLDMLSRGVITRRPH